MRECSGWISILSCRHCGSNAVKGKPPKCAACGVFRRHPDLLRCEMPLEVESVSCDTCHYPTPHPREMEFTAADA